MAHNLDTFNGAVTMAYQGGAPWHKLGTKLPAGATVAEAMAAAHLDTTVELRPIFRHDASGALVQIEDKRATVRAEDDRYLATVGADYKIIQNRDAFGILDTLCQEHGLTIATAGALDGGRRVWALARMADTITVTDGDDVNGYLMVRTGHDGTTGLSCRFTPIRVVCQNTEAIALRNGADAVTIRHTASADQRLREAARIMSAMVGAMKEAGETFAAFAARRMSRSEIAEYITSVFPDDPEGPHKTSDTIKQRRRDVAALVWAGKGADLAGSNGDGSSLWQCYNAITEYFDHVRPGQAKSAAGAYNANVSAIVGANHSTKLDAFKIAARQYVYA